MEVECNSRNYKYTECPVPGALRILSAHVVTRNSRSSCNNTGEGPAPEDYPENAQTPGIFGYDGSLLWVHSGCRAIFEVCYSGRLYII